MSKHLSPLEKEVLIQRYLSKPQTNINDFCEVNNISIPAFKKWLNTYKEEGIEGLITKRNGEQHLAILPDGVDPSTENLKREIMKLRIENERLKKAILWRRVRMGIQYSNV